MSGIFFFVMAVGVIVSAAIGGMLASAYGYGVLPIAMIAGLLIGAGAMPISEAIEEFLL